jgi:hypothetical protein
MDESGEFMGASYLFCADFSKVDSYELEIATPQMRTMWFDAFKHGKYHDLE